MKFIVKVRWPDNSCGASSLFTDKQEAVEYADWLRMLPEYKDTSIEVVTR